MGAVSECRVANAEDMEELMRIARRVGGEMKVWYELKEVQLWCVMGIPQTLYDNKLRAERAARLAFPDEDADKRYARVSFKTFYEEV